MPGRKKKAGKRAPVAKAPHGIELTEVAQEPELSQTEPGLGGGEAVVEDAALEAGVDMAQQDRTQRQHSRGETVEIDAALEAGVRQEQAAPAVCAELSSGAAREPDRAASPGAGVAPPQQAAAEEGADASDVAALAAGQVPADDAGLDQAGLTEHGAGPRASASAEAIASPADSSRDRVGDWGGSGRERAVWSGMLDTVLQMRTAAAKLWRSRGGRRGGMVDHSESPDGHEDDRAALRLRDSIREDDDDSDPRQALEGREAREGGGGAVVDDDGGGGSASNRGELRAGEHPAGEHPARYHPVQAGRGAQDGGAAHAGAREGGTEGAGAAAQENGAGEMILEGYGRIGWAHIYTRRGAQGQLAAGHRVSRPRGTGSVGDSVGEGAAGEGGGRTWAARWLVEVRDLHVRSAVREARRNWCQYLLGLVSVFLSVLVVAVVHTGYEYTPLFFLSIAQYNAGQVDAEVVAGSWTNHKFLDHARLRAQLAALAAGAGTGREDGQLFNYSAPRRRFPSSAVWAAAACNTSLLNPLDRVERYFSAGWREGLPDCGYYSYSDDQSCLAKLCGMPAKASLFVIDSDLEQRMGRGSGWKLPPVRADHVYLQRPLAHRLNVSEGDVVVVKVDLKDLIQVIASLDTAASLGGPFSELYQAAESVLVPVTVQGIFGESLGKFDADETDVMVLEYAHFFALVSRALVPGAEALADDFAKADPYSLAQSVSFNFPPPRVNRYLSHDYAEVTGRVLKFVARLTALLGYDKIEVDLTLLRELKELSIVAMFLRLVVNMIVMALSGLLCLLIYSLLMVSVETRTFDLGVSRMVGMTRRRVVQLLVVQTLLQSIPGWCMGLVAAHMVSLALFRQLADIFKADIAFQLQPMAVLQASLMGLLVPIIAAILPIRQALGTTLTDALDISRNRVAAVAVTTTRAGQREVPVALVCGAGVMTGFGAMIYYLLPLALVAFDLSLMLYIFMGLLLGMIAGLALLSLNLERPLEHFVAAVVLCWTGNATRTTLHKNLVAHRVRNRKTTLMYALSVGFILFVIVTLSMQIESFEMQHRQLMGTPVRLHCPFFAQLDHQAVDSVVQENPLILDAAYASHSLQTLVGQRTYLKNLGRIFSHRNDVYAVTPNAAQVLDQRFLVVNQQRSGLPWSVTEDLYSVRGSQSVMLGSLFRASMGLHLNGSLLLEIKPYPWVYSQLRPLAFLDCMGAFWQSPHPTADRQDALVSFVTLARLARRATGQNYQVRDIPVKYVFFKLKAGLSDEDLDGVVDTLKRLEAVTYCEVEDVRQKFRGLQTAKEAMQLFAAGTTAVALLICFFSLTSSMIANIHQQSKEIGLLRALGVTRVWIARVYLLEAMVLVLSAAALGVAIGSILAFTISAQRQLFTQLPLPFSFPTTPMLVITVASMLSGVFAAFVPAMRLLHRKIVGLLRSQ